MKLNVAEQCRAMGLRVGDTIEGTERYGNWWSTARLTLLWLGDTNAAWSVTEISAKSQKWSTPRESANWTLDARKWRKIKP